MNLLSYIILELQHLLRYIIREIQQAIAFELMYWALTILPDGSTEQTEFAAFLKSYCQKRIETYKRKRNKL